MTRFLIAFFTVHVAGIAAQESPSDISPFDDHGELRVQLFGRHEVSDSSDIVFDAPAFEIAFSVAHTSRVEIVLQQEYHVPEITDGHPTENRPAAVTTPDCADTGFQIQTFTVYVNGVAQGPATLDDVRSSCVFCTFDTGMYISDVQSTHQYPVATGLDATQSYEIRIVKDSEADFNNCKTTYENYVTFSNIRLWGEGAKVEPPRTLNYLRPRIEFIGDSKMTGMCNLCHEVNATADPKSVLGSSTSLAWPKQMCDKLGADCRMTTWSGLGLTASPNQLDLWKDREVMTNQSSVRKSGWKANVVIINLALDDDVQMLDIVDDVDAFWDGIKERLLNFAVEVQQTYYYNTVIMLACVPTFPTSADVFCRKAREVVATARNDTYRVWHAAAWDARGLLTSQTQCCGLPDKDASTLLADSAIAACNVEKTGACFQSHAPPAPAPPHPPPSPTPWYRQNPPLMSFIWVGGGVALLSMCALYVGGAPDMPCKKKVDPEAASAPLAA